MDEVDAMFQAIQEELEEQRRRFDKKEQRKKDGLDYKGDTLWCRG